ncbi:peptidase M1-like protein [Murinocardiopsis flavida]|uniref:Aminopeptidase N n=1 Tax=Murinocardiopsis flavida TaxID=645275 RepID=A0A2P8D6U4_9ACTN|nr:M1 family metallopeptidase [Murinocardiopsis flavida]PSK92911.1 peptidase M1-like protein [Murinocardiopsis flavida]
MSANRLRWCGTAAPLVLMLVALPAAQAAAAPGDGIGDPYFPSYGNTGYNVSHYDVRLDYRPKTDVLSGTTTIIARATEDIDAFTLDFLLDVDSVRVNGRKAEHKRVGEHKVQVTPASDLDEGEKLTAVVKYADKPSSYEYKGISGWIRTADGAVALGQPEVSWWWYPANDHPLDKASFDLRMSVPKGLQAISVGRSTGVQHRGDKSIYTWRQSEPQATYLATVAIGAFEITQEESTGGLPVLSAYGKSLGDTAGPARASVERTAEITEFQETQFGPYPFDALGGIVPDADIGFALETQTRPVYDPGFFAAGSNTYVVAHEQAHQWFGDDVSVTGWDDIWINEGFASYAEWLWSENEGEGTAQELADFTYHSYPADDPFWQVEPGDPGADNVFHPAVYDRGALAVHALRNEVGDDDFFTILQTWTEDNAGGNATVADFIALSEKVSGKQLDALFDTWLYTKGRPELNAAGRTAVESRSAPAEPKSWDTIQRTHERIHAHGSH